MMFAAATATPPGPATIGLGAGTAHPTATLDVNLDVARGMGNDAAASRLVPR